MELGYNSGDPAAGTGQIIDTEDLSASSFYFKLGYTADGGSLTLSNVTSGILVALLSLK